MLVPPPTNPSVMNILLLVCAISGLEGTKPLINGFKSVTVFVIKLYDLIKKFSSNKILQSSKHGTPPVGVPVGDGVGVGVNPEVGVGVGVIVGVIVGVGVGVGVNPEVGVGVGVNPEVGVGVGVAPLMLNSTSEHSGMLDAPPIPTPEFWTIVKA